MVQLTRRHALGGAAAALAGAAISPATTKAAGLTATSGSTCLFDDVMNIITRRSGVSREAILSGSREPDILWARQRAMYIYRLLARRPLTELGRRFGAKGGMAGTHAVLKIEKARDEDPVFNRKIDDLVHECMVEAVRNGHRMHPDFAPIRCKLEVQIIDFDNPPMPPWCV